jgi:hypothetical protein
MESKLKSVFVLILFLMAGSSYADDTTRRAIINQIVEAQGLQQMFQGQLDQSKSVAGQYGRDIFNRVMNELAPGQTKPDSKMEAIFSRYLDSCASMWTAKELADAWAKHYGKGLSDQDLDQILAYYLSPAGKKDVAASQYAMVNFTRETQTESIKRMNAATDKLIAELKAAVSK